MNGEMAEWSNAAASKAAISLNMGSGVRIPLSPPTFARRASVGRPTGKGEQHLG